MQATISVLMTVAAVLAALVFVGVGLFSLVSLVWGDLLEREESSRLSRPS